MVNKPHIEENEYDDTIAYYQAHFDDVSLLKCGKCKEALGLQVTPRTHVNEQGVEVPLALGLPLDAAGHGVVSLGDNLLSRRVRLDEHADGPMMGYQCKCGNDTRLSKAEKHHQPDEGWAQRGLLPHEVAKLRSEIKDCGHKADYAHRGGRTRYETFHVEVLA